MRVKLFAALTVLLLFFLAAPAPTQTGGDKKKDPDPQKKDHDKISATTKINGKTLDEWIHLIPVENNKDRSQTEVAIKSIIMYGPELAKKAVPTLLTELKRHKTTTPIDMNVRVNGAMALGMILSSVQKVDQDQVKDTVALLKLWLKDDQVIVKLRVANALTQLGTLAKDTISELCDLTRNPGQTWETRQAGAVALGTVAYDEKTPDKKAVDTLYGTATSGLNDSAVKVRLACLASLSVLRVGEHDFKGFKKAIDARMAKEPDPIWHLRAHLAVYHAAKVGKEYAELPKRIDKIIEILDNPDNGVRVEVAQALGGLGDEAKTAVPRLIKELRNPDNYVMGWCIWALGRMEKQAKDALPWLQQIASDKNVPEEFRATAQEAIDVISGKVSTKKDEPPKKGEK
jgi:HEAT repeat protein